MKLRTKTIIAISLFTFMIFAMLQIVNIFVIQPSFTNLENQESKESITQARSTINYRLSQLEGKVKDYSSWDDTYDFVQNENQDYVESNFIDATFENLNLNLVAIMNNNRSVVFCQSFDLVNATMVNTSESTRETLVSDAFIWTFSSPEDELAGIMLLDNQPMIVATAPIITSLGDGPIMGGMLFGRYVDAQEIGQLMKIMGLNFSLSTISDFSLQKDSQLVESLLSDGQDVVLEENSPETVSGYALIKDIHSKPMFVLQVSQNRVAFQQGQFVADLFLFVSLALSLSFGAGVLILIERNFTKPMTKLASYVKEMPLNSYASEAKNKFGTEETAVLANAVRDTMNKKLEAMTEVSRMVAHDLRNPLTGIKGASYLLKNNYGAKMGEEGNGLLKTIDDCVEYSDKIVSDLLEYSCEIKLDKIKTNPKRLVNDSLSTFMMQSNIQVINEASDEFSLFVDNGKIERVFSNLIKNAFDAMPDGGKLHITSRKVKGQVEIDFSDSGMGISKDSLKKLWTPFFTTKAKGMGVGLSICKRIIEAHGGRIEVHSIEGKGTCFAVFLSLSK